MHRIGLVCHNNIKKLKTTQVWAPNKEEETVSKEELQGDKGREEYVKIPQGLPDRLAIWTSELTA